MKIINYRVDAATPNGNVKASVLTAVNNVKWINTEIKILAENGTISLTTRIESKTVKKLFKYFALKNIDGTIRKVYD